MRTRKRESVSVTFHYLTREIISDDGDVSHLPISADEFFAFIEKLKSLQPLAIDSEEFKKIILLRNKVPIDHVEKIDNRTMFGSYKGIYTGHSFENTEKGKISADSANLRPFYFILYISESGRIYIGAQYLGMYGSYISLRDTLISFLDDKTYIVAKSFRMNYDSFEGVEPTEVRVRISQKDDEINKKNIFKNGMFVAFKKSGNGQEFSREIKRRLVPSFGSSRENVQKAISNMLRASELIDVSDDQIEDCTVVGEINGKKKTIYLIEEGSFATHFPLAVGINVDGHPEMEPTKKAMFDILSKKIIETSE